MSARERDDVSTDDPQDGVATPDDRSRGAEDDAVTAAGQREGSTLDERLSLETPDVTPRRPDAVVGEIVDEDRPDEEPDMIGELARSEEDTAPAEELAMRVTQDAPGATSDDTDGYVDDDVSETDGATG